MSYWASLPGDVLAQGAPVLVAALGGLLAEAAGALNIALEGLLALGSFAYAWATPALGQNLGFLAALLSGTAFAALLALVAFRLKADLFVVGLAGNIIAQGGLALAAWRVFGTKGVAAFPGLLSERLDMRSLADLPLVAQLLAQRGSTFLLLLASLVLWALYGASPFGLRVRAAGQKEESLALAGVDPRQVRLIAFAISGAAAALAGAALSAQTGAYVPGASAGRGWIALVAIYLGRQKPAGTALAVLAFAVLAALSNALQALTFPPELALALPYAVTALIVLTGRVRLRGRRHRDGEAA